MAAAARELWESEPHRVSRSGVVNDLGRAVLAEGGWT